jgi:hypothetical protein
MSYRVDRLVERVPRKLARAFRPEVGLDTVAGQALPAAQGEDCEQTQPPLLLRGKRDWTCVAVQGKGSQQLEDQHFFTRERAVTFG